MSTTASPDVALASAPELTPIDKIRAQITEEVTRTYEQKFALWQQKEFADYKASQNEQLEILVADYMAKQEEARKPLTTEQIQDLLAQEYVKFEVPVEVDEEVKKFRIRELPASCEEQFYKEFVAVLKEHSSELAAFDQADMDMPFEQKLLKVMSMFSTSFDLLPSAVALILNWDGKDPIINKTWVKNHMSSHRMWTIINAQMEVNKLRDFLSQLFQSGTMATMMTSKAPILQSPAQPVR